LKDYKISLHFGDKYRSIALSHESILIREKAKILWGFGDTWKLLLRIEIISPLNGNILWV